MSRKHRQRLGALVVGLAILAGVWTSGAVWASHDFSDVKDSNPFHDDISWMADYGITTGYGDGTFRPANNVSRQAMAAFMRRLSANTESWFATEPFTSETAFGWAVFCDPGSRPIAGGGQTTEIGLAITDSAVVVDGPDLGWGVRWESLGGAKTGTAEVWVTCVPFT